MFSFLNNLFTVTSNNNTMYSKHWIGNRNVHSKLPIVVFPINSISSIESEEFRKTSNVSTVNFGIRFRSVRSAETRNNLLCDFFVLMTEIILWRESKTISGILPNLFKILNLPIYIASVCSHKMTVLQNLYSPVM